MERKRIVANFPIRSEFDKNVHVNCKTLSNVASDFRIPVESRYFTDDR